MAARYQIRLKDQTGNEVAVMTLDRGPVLRMSIDHEVNVPSMLALELGADDPVIDLFEIDGQVEVWRRNRATAPPTEWYLEFEGFHIYPDLELDAKGQWTFTSYCEGYLSLLAGRVIAWPEGSAQAAKAGVGETVIKEYVYENAGAGATAAGGRYLDGVQPGLAIQTDGGAGGAWSGDRAGRDLLETVREIAEITGLDIDIVGTGPATFEFRTYPGQRGSDRSLPVVDKIMGTNAAGLVPVIFSPALGNMARAHYYNNRQDERNAFVVLGEQDEEGDVDWTTALDAAAIAVSPWRRREATVNASNQETGGSLQDAGAEALNQNRVQEAIDFDVIQLPRRAYGQHYFRGDIVSAQFRGLEFSRKLVRVKINVEGGKETIGVETRER